MNHTKTKGNIEKHRVIPCPHCSVPITATEDEYWQFHGMDGRSIGKPILVKRGEQNNPQEWTEEWIDGKKIGFRLTKKEIDFFSHQLELARKEERERIKEWVDRYYIGGYTGLEEPYTNRFIKATNKCLDDLLDYLK